MALKSQQSRIMVGDGINPVTATALAILSSGAVSQLVLTNPGAGYVSAPTVTITGSGSATATAALTDDKVSSTTITAPGSGFTVAPAVAFSAPPAISYSELEECNSISGPDGKASLIDTTHLRSLGKEYLSGLPDFGQIQLECNFTQGTQQMAIRDLYVGQSLGNGFRFLIPRDNTNATFHTFSFSAVVNSWNLDVKVDSKVVLKIGLQVTGGVYYTQT